MRISHLNVRYKRIAAALFVAAVVLSILYKTGGYVAAYRETKNAYIFPTAVSADGWNNPEGALSQELSASAPYQSFSSSNAAYISIGSNTPVIEVPQGSDTSTASSTSEIDENATTTPDAIEAPATPEMPPDNTDVPTVPAEASPENTVEAPVETPAETPAEAPVDTAPATAPEASITDVFKKLVHSLVPTVYATTSEEVIDTTVAGTSAETEDVPTCFLQQKECHTITLTGFSVAGEITETTFQKATLNFSFAANIGETELVDDKLEVRYYHDGKWREVGEIYLNKQFSNASNGDYFTATLDDIEAWEELSDVKVVIEYDRNNDSAVDLFLDAVWIDTQYRELLADVVSDDDTQPELPDNVELELNLGGPVDALVLADGTHITFPYTDDLDDSLMIRTDKATYSHTGETVYASLTNTSATVDSVRLYTAFSRGFGSVVSIEELKKNVPTTTEIPQYQEVTYFCAAGWVAQEENASSTDDIAGSVCIETGEIHQCSALNADKTNCSVSQVQVGSESSVSYTSGWVPLVFADAQEAQSRIESALPPLYRAVAQTSELIEILPGQTVYVRLRLESTGSDTLQFALLAEGSTLAGELNGELLKEERALAEEGEVTKSARKKGNARMFGRAEFDGDELPQFKFQFKSKRNFVSRGLNTLLGRGNEFAFEEVTFRRSDGTEVTLPVAVEYKDNGEWTLEITTHPRSFRPGKYMAEITMREGEDVFTETVEFYWGLLAMNVNQSSYVPGEMVPIAMAALDDLGDTICDADLQLSVTDPAGTAHNVPVEQSGLCGDNNVIDVADYLATYTAGGVGAYTLALTEYDNENRIIHRIFDSFTVEENVPFNVRRSGMTRIYPVAPYTMDLELYSANGFVGEFVESVPADFEILAYDGAEVRMYGGAKNLVWNVDLAPGERTTVSYTYDAPDLSPYMFLLGPAKVQDGTGIPFEEPRQWKLASDAVGNMLIYWDQTWIPAGWTCVSCVPADAFYGRFVMGSSTAGINGGATTHTHTGTGAVAATANSQTVSNNNQTTPTLAHTHTFTPTIAATSSLPAYRQLAILQYSSAGEPPSLPAGAIAMFDATVPSGWTAYSAQNNRFALASSTSAIGSTGGSNTHVHSVTGTTGAAATTFLAANPGTAVAVGAAAHTHTITSTSTQVVSQEPPYIGTIFGKLNATSTPTNDMIGMWSGDAPTGWTTTSSSSEPFANRFALASSTYGTTGGSFTHSHINMSITSNGPSATVNRNNAAGTNASAGAHTHTISVTGITTTDHMPPYRTAVFAKRVGGATATSTLHDIPFANEKTGTSTPWFYFTFADPDGSDTLVYQFQWDDDSDLDSAPIGDRTSDVETGCSPNCFSNTVNGGDTSPFNEAERIRFTIQTPLVSGTTYYWRVRARESGGGGTWSAWATTTSFTYVANVSPAQWFQTEDAQFDSNTLSGAETYGSDSARLTLAAQTEALIGYGEGVVQTPRYRIWNGTAWSAELSAQNVGGTIQWVAVKGGTTRDEYVMGTQDASNDVNVQVYNGTTDTWGNLQEVTTTVSGPTRRGFDVAYETTSGDAIVVYCDGDADPSYYVWNGTSWTSGGSINLTSANNCEWIKLASDPLSDEIILVARDTGATYEAQVWSGSAWGNARQIGTMTDVANEGIGLEYEASGNQALVTVSNGNAASFAWTSWDGTSWGINTTQGLGDDFEWGILRADDGSDNMALCYVDADSDVGVVRWDGNAWIAFSERDVTSNGNTGRPIDCAFETTAGRDGYIMATYSDTAAARYQVWNGTSWAAEATLSTIQDSITVESIRTGDGLVLSVFNDDVNTQFDFSYWNGTSWSTIDTLETGPSVAVAPFMQPFSMAPKVYSSSSGTMTSSVIDFDHVPNRQTWGEVLWRTTEPNGTDVTIQVLYENAGVCNTLVPNGTLPGNSTGFQSTSSPLNISALSTSTYNRICIRATFSTTNQSAPSLDEWTVTWERQAYLTQTHFRWYANAASSLTPSDPWPSGGTDLSEDVAIPTANAPAPNDVLRLRLGILAENVALSAGDLSMKLQYAEGSSCSAALSWHDVGAIGSTTAAWRGYNNAALTDGATLASNLLSTADARGSYEEENDSALNPNQVNVNDEGEWDWVIQHNTTNNVSYCFRAVTSGGEVLNEYDLYPALVTNAAPETPTLEQPFNNEAVASTTPFFEFVTEDPESDDITYQIQIDDDPAFGSVNIDRDSQNFIDEFTNLVTPSDKDPFTTAQTVRFIPTSALTDGTTYYWRVRGKDRLKSNEWSAWSTVQSVTVISTTAISTWRQTTTYQFSEDGHDDTEATSTNDIILTPPNTTGTTTSSLIDFDWRTTGNAWGSLSFTDTETTSDVKYHIEYFDEDLDDWTLVPDADLSGNAAGFDTSPVSLLSVSPTIYNQIRIRANLTNSGATPRIHDWQIAWGLAVEQPQLTALFDNEKTATTTPTFSFASGDPQSNDLVYEISISTTVDFTSSTTRQSSVHAGFTNTASSTDTSPFTQDDRIEFKLQAADALTNGTTYWWRARAIDPTGGNVWSVWSDVRSFTVDTSVNVSTWFQTTNEQWATDALSNIETSGGSAQITSTIREAFTAYAEGTVQVPRFRIWNGTTWGTELSGVSIGDTIRFVEVDAAPTRDEYIIATMGSTGVVDAQIVDGATDTAGNATEIVATAPDTTQRGFDVAYETSSGDALAVACSGTEATYKVWNGTSWSASNAITLAVSANCEWIKLVSDPTSDEIILVARDATTGATDYNALVWNGSSWGNSMTMGSQVTVTNEGIAVEYEESGNQAIVLVSNGANNNFIWQSWNGSAWSGTNTVTIGNDFANGRLVRDDGSDAMNLCYVDLDTDIGYVRWTGSAWTASAEFEATGNSNNSRPVSCEFETSTGRDGYIMMPYSDTIQAEYVFWNGSVLSTAALLTTISDAAEIRTVRTGDGLILVLAYDDANTEYDFTYWNGTSWSTEQVLDTTSITTVVPPTIPLDIVARRYPAFIAGTVESSTITFSDGSGPKWGSISFSKTTPGSSSVRLHLYYLTSTSSWAIIPDSVFPGNVAGTTTSPIDISNINRITYSTLRMVADLACVSGNCPTLNDWTLTWAQGINVSGTVQQYNQSTNVTSGTVAVAVNGTIQSGKTAVISGGTFTIPNVTVFQDDIVTVFVDGAADANEAVAVTKYDGDGDVTGLTLYERHVSLGSGDNPTLSNLNLSLFNNSNDEDVFFEVDAGPDFTGCASGSCSDMELYIQSGTTYRPDSSSAGDVSVYDLENNGTITPDGVTITIAGSWDNNATFNKDSSNVVFTATSSTRTIDSTGATLSAFNNVTLGQGSGSATWSLSSALDIDGNLTVNFGSLSPNSRAVTLGGNLTLGASGVFVKGSATTTFDGTGTATWTDNTVAKQDLGTVAIDGTTKTVQLGAAGKVTNLTIGTDDTFSAGNNYAIEVQGNWTNSNSFVAQSGTVTFTATTSGKTITPGSSNFYNVVFNGGGGNWSIVGPVTAGNDFTITTGTVTLPANSTTTVTGNFANSGAFQHNNGVLFFNSSASGKTITTTATSSFYDMSFNGSGAWTISSANATSSRHVFIAQGSLTLPSGIFAVGGSFLKSGGSFTHNSGTLKLVANDAQVVRLSGSDTHNLTFSGSGGSWSFFDASATTTGAFRIENGTPTLPSGTFAVGGSWTVTSGAFTHNSGSVRFYSSTSGQTIQPNGSSFYNMLFDSATGGWTLSQSATSTNNFILNNAANFTLSSGLALGVGGTFTNTLSPASTTWTGSRITLYSGGTYSINSKTNAGDTYATLILSTSTKVSMWNSSTTVAVVNTGSSLYSQDANGVDGDLYIYGTYTRGAGTEYWTYATDFDGTALGGSSRAVNVRIASSSTLTFNGGLLQIVGASNASTTIANQGAGAYSLSVAGGTINAQYYSVRNTYTNGLDISGTTAITSLADGDYQLSTNGGSMMSVASTVIDANTLLQIQRVRFATSTGITSGFNVTETGSPTSNWWFRNHYGNYAGENYDSDPGGNPGHIRWDDSNLTITVSGRVYSDHGSTAIGNPPCDGSTQSVRIVVNGGTAYTGSCNAGTGAYSISGIAIAGDVVLTAYLNTNGGKRAVTISRTPTVDITNFDLYENAVIVRHEDVTPISISQIAVYTGTQDTDIPFTASTSTPPSTLALRSDTELYIWPGKTFTPAGNVSLVSGGSGNIRDGRLMLATSSAFIATGSEAHSVGGGLSVASGATFTTASSTFTFTATTTGKVFNSSVALSFDNLTFNGAGGGWTLSNTAPISVVGTFALTAGTISGTGDLVVSSGNLTGAGVFAMTGGTVTLTGTGSFGSASSWSFNNLTLGTGGTNTTSKTGVGTTTVAGVLTVSSGQTLNASSTNWVLSGGGTPLVVNGTFNVQTAPFFFTATSATTIYDVNYAALYLAPAAAGTPTYEVRGGSSVSATTLNVGGTNPVSVDLNANDPTLTVSGNVTITSGSTLTASNVNVLNVGGSWTNSGTFTSTTGSTVNFNSTDAGETINPGTSSFYNLTFNGVGGGWTIVQNATSTNTFSLTNASAFTLSPNRTLAVGGTFTNSVGGSATEWATSTLSLYSGTSYSINTKSAGSDTYGTLLIGANTDIKSWNSSAATTTVDATGSLYSQDHAAVDGSLYVWGEYVRASGNDYWSYATDFDGTSLSTTSPRQVNVRIATSSTLTFSGGGLEILGTTTATTTIANQGTGRYGFTVSGGTLNAQYYQVRDTSAAGLTLSGSPTITTLSDGDYLLNVNGGAMMTVAATVIDANPLKIFLRNNFSTAVGSGFNVLATGSAGSSWKFNLHYGSYDGESFDSDPAGDPGYLRWDDSSSAITIAGNVYSDEGPTVSTVCDNSTQVVRLKIQGAGTYTSSCNSSTGAYSIPGVAFNPGDTMTVFLDTAGGRRAASVSVDPVSSISNMHLYENRVIVRHEDVNPITIAQMAQYDSDQDADIPFDAEDTATDTLLVNGGTKLLVFASKTFTPGGNVMLSGGSANAWDGTLELATSSIFTIATNQSHAIGGSLIVGSGASLTSASSTFTMTATTTGKIITLNGSSLYNVTFNGSGGNWSFSDSSMTTTNDFTITAGTVTMPTATSTIGGSFQNTGGTFQHNNGAVVLSATAAGKTVRVNNSSFYTIEFNGVGGAWSFFDSAATSSNNFIITNGTVTAPSTRLTVGGSFQNFGTFTSGISELKLIATATGKSIRAGGSAIYAMLINGIGGSWSFTDTNATITRDLTILNGSTTLPTGTLSVGGSWSTAGGTFTANGGTVTMNATTTGKTIDPGTSSFASLTLNSSAGGWTILQNATTTGAFSLTSANTFVLTANRTLAVGGTFTNGVGGAATTWATTTLSLYSGTNYSMNTKSAGNDVYGTLFVGPNTDVRMWNSTAATTTVSVSGSLYSQDNAGLSGTPVDGALYIWGEYVQSGSADYWSYATDFDGTALGGSSRQVNVRIATSSSVTLSGGTLEIQGATATTTIQNQGTGRYAFSVTGGTLNASHYRIRNTDPNGVSFSGTPTITSLDYGDLELDVSGGSMISLTDTAVDANASKQINYVSFATSTGITSGFNVKLSGTPTAAWTFLNHNGNYDGEAYDSDGVDSCGKIRWSDSSCLFVNQGHYRWRQDDGGIGAPNSEWYNASWSKRKKIAVSNPTASAMTNQAIKILVPYDGDMQSDFEDLRFTDSSGTTTIPYWIESSTASATSTVWVKLSSIPANSSSNIYMYYGNSGAADGGSGATTFKGFDDFEDDNLTEYTNTSLFDTDTTFNHNYLYGLDAGTNTELRTTTGGMYRTGSLTGVGDTIRFYQYMDAAAEDEPCTLFAVQNQTQNYAVCLDQYPTERVTLREDVLSNDGSGGAGGNSLMASTTVTFATGWYEVVIDWLANNTIDVNVYDSTGALFANVSGTDPNTSYSSGGFGFSYWFQHAGWDFFSVRPYVSSAPTYVFGEEQVSGGASWYAAEDTAVSGVSAGTNLRLRFTVQNTGSPLSSEEFALQYAAKGSALSCEAVSVGNFTNVPTTSGGCGSSPACMTTSSQFADQTSVSDLLSRPATMSFSQGKIMEDPSFKSNAMNVPTNAATEVEYNFQLTGNAIASSYCFRTARVSTGGLDSYDHVAEVVLVHAPTISDWKLNYDTDISLTEGTTTVVSATGTVTDLNGYADIVAASSTIYRSSVVGAAQCSSNANNCYVQPTCTLSNCSGNSCAVTCTAQMAYLADPTDIGDYSADNWLAQLRIRDASGLYTSASAGQELFTTYGLSISTPNINFGALDLGTDTGATTTITTVVNTGNASIDIELYGTDLEGPGGPAGKIDVGEQKVATSTFTYASCSVCQALAGIATPVDLVVDLPKPTATSTTVSDDLYWGIRVPIGTAATTLTGQNTFMATGDN